jgi:hypothetical protein
MSSGMLHRVNWQTITNILPKRGTMGQATWRNILGDLQIYGTQHLHGKERNGVRATRSNVKM